MVGLKDITKSLGSQSFLLGVGVAALGYFLGPQIKQSLRPVLVKGAEGALMLGNKTKEMMADGIKKMDNVVFEGSGAATAGMANKAPEEMNLTVKLMQEIREEGESSRKMIEDLRNSIESIRGEIAEIRGKGVPLEKGNNPFQSGDNPQ